MKSQSDGSHKFSQKSSVTSHRFSHANHTNTNLNPIEHVWAAMKRRLNDSIFSTKEALTDAVLEQWSRVGGEGLEQQLISSMPRRMNAVLAAEGGATKY